MIAGLPFYDPSKDFTCLDGSLTVPFSSVNDDYCDCADGSDEPGIVCACTCILLSLSPSTNNINIMITIHITIAIMYCHHNVFTIVIHHHHYHQSSLHHEYHHHYHCCHGLRRHSINIKDRHCFLSCAVTTVLPPETRYPTPASLLRPHHTITCICVMDVTIRVVSNGVGSMLEASLSLNVFVIVILSCLSFPSFPPNHIYYYHHHHDRHHHHHQIIHFVQWHLLYSATPPHYHQHDHFDCNT